MEELQKQILELQDQIKAKDAELNNHKDIIEGLKEKELKNQEQILRLRDMNTDLFLRVSQPVPTETIVEEKPTESQESAITLEDILG